MAWTLTQAGSFTGANTAVGGAGNTTAVPGWADNLGNLWHIVSNQANCALPAAQNNYGSNALLRPAGEASINSRIIAAFTGSAALQGQIGTMLRWTSNASFYLFAYDVPGGGMSVFRGTGPDAFGQIGTTATAGTLTAGHNYTLETYANGANPTSLFAQLIDTTSSTTLATFGPFSDSTGPQTSGRQAVTTAVGGIPGTTQAYNSAATYTWTVASASIAIAPSSGAAMQDGVSVAITGTGTAFTGSPFSITGGSATVTGAGYGTMLESQSVTNATTGSISIRTGVPGFGPITVTDTISGATATYTVTAPALGALKIGLIGDSITAGTIGPPTDPQGGNTTPSPTLEATMAARLTTLGYTPTISNKAVAGSSTPAWLPGAASGHLAAAETAFNTAAVTLVSIRHGTNDCHPVSGANGNGNVILTAAQHRANIRTIINHLFANVPTLTKVVLHKAPWIEPNSPLAGVGVPTNANAIIDGYWQAVQDLIDGVKVFSGDTSMHALSSADPLSFLSADGVHWKASSVYTNYDAPLQVAAILKAYGAPQRYRGGFIRAS
jgi:hypothetical protein